MESILHDFGIEPKLLITQLINFLIFFVVMWKFVMPRIRGLMKDRQSQISDALKAADEAKTAAAQATAEREEQQAAAKKEAAAILKEAKDAAKTQTAQQVAAAKDEAERVLARARKQISTEQEAALQELRAQVAALTVETTRKVLTDVVTEADRARIVTAATERLKKEQV